MVEDGAVVGLAVSLSTTAVRLVCGARSTGAICGFKPGSAAGFPDISFPILFVRDSLSSGSGGVGTGALELKSVGRSAIDVGTGAGVGVAAVGAVDACADFGMVIDVVVC